jgi:hypothetical protein
VCVCVCVYVCVVCDDAWVCSWGYRWTHREEDLKTKLSYGGMLVINETTVVWEMVHHHVGEYDGQGQGGDGH